MIKKISIIVMFSLMVALFIPFMNGCDSDSEDKETLATQVAVDWTIEDDQTITDEIIDTAVELFTGSIEIPGISELLTEDVLQQVADNASWTYSTPEKIDDDKYKVVATATSTIDIQTVGGMELSVDLILTVDTEDEEVTSWVVDPDSFEYALTGS